MRNAPADRPTRAVGALADSGRPELDADPWSGRTGGLRDGVLPGALAGATHNQQVAVADHESQRGPAAMARAQQQRTGIAQRHDSHDGLAGLAAGGLAVPGDAVPAVAVQAQ